ncbi:hypothetical protein OPQ81_009506 [Rhizoctonia solani]|nr:hypothetical protein OPQ81_009506 [Rhizoctonia solani]
MATQARAAYRAFLREVRKSSIFPRPERGSFLSKQIHVIANSPGQTPQTFRSHVLTAAAFLKAQREHQILMDSPPGWIGIAQRIQGMRWVCIGEAIAMGILRDFGS